MMLNKLILFNKQQGFTLLESVVGVGITAVLFAFIAYLTSIGHLSRGSIEKKSESFEMVSNLIAKLHGVPLNELLLICQDKGALNATPADPCVTSTKQLALLSPHGPWAHPLEAFFDATINVTTMQNSNTTASPAISCVHINNCRYLISSSLFEVQLTYHWHDPVTAEAQSRRLSFRRGVR